MADIDLVIKMDEEVYKRIKSLSKGDYFELKTGAQSPSSTK